MLSMNSPETETEELSRELQERKKWVVCQLNPSLSMIQQNACNGVGAILTLLVMTGMFLGEVSFPGHRG